MKVTKDIFLFPFKTLYMLTLFIASALSIITSVAFIGIIAIGFLTITHKNDPQWIEKISDWIQPFTDFVQSIIVNSVH